VRSSFNVAGLKPLFDEIIAAEMTVRPDGTYSGEMSVVPPTGEVRAQILSDYCDAEGFRLDECVAYADSSSDLPLFEAVGFPVAVNPETRLAAIARKRGWLVEHWSKAKRRPRPLLPIGDMIPDNRTPEGLLVPRVSAPASAQSGSRTAWARSYPPRELVLQERKAIPHRLNERGRSVKALQIRVRSRSSGSRASRRPLRRPPPRRSGRSSTAPIDDPECPGEGWHRVHTRLAGICGSDLSLVEGHASTYFDDFVSFPFVPGHEVVGELDDGARVVIEPVLGHAARGHVPPFPGAAPGDGDDYAHLATPSRDGMVEPGIQTGFCCSTGGGWAPWFWAHESQLHRIADDVPDERAVMIEPIAGGIHAALLTLPTVAEAKDPIVAVLGAGTMGLAAIAGLKRYVPGVRIVVGARYPHQMGFAKAIGADVVVAGAKLDRAVRREAGCHMIGDQLSSGAHATIDAVGTSESITDCLRITRPRGRVVLLGMPSDVKLDLTGLWHRETELKGAYTYGTETLADGTTRPHVRPRGRHRQPLPGRADAVGHVPPRRPRRRHRPRRRRRPPRRHQDRLRPPMMDSFVVCAPPRPAWLRPLRPPCRLASLGFVTSYLDLS
jgi:threonine dehydrogenase-like Zn-dependent dehydrogenase